MSRNSGVPASPERPRARVRAKGLPEVVRGVIIGLSDNGDPLIDFYANPQAQPIVAATTVVVEQADVGRLAVLAFEDGDCNSPIILGIVRTVPNAELPNQKKPVEVSADGQSLTISATKEIVLRCGEASITLTRAGKVIIRGTYLLSRSSGPNRIKGASIHLN